VHVGTHADAFAHVVSGGATIDRMPLDAYVGRCQVIRVDVARATAIRPGDLTAPIRTPRVLLATGTFPDPTRFNEDFAALSVELADALHAANVRLVGIDTPSVELFAATELPVHRRLVEHGIGIMEGLRLDHVPAGEYELIALPLRLVGCDASPLRAVLRSIPA
jgi:arylformamidase